MLCEGGVLVLADVVGDGSVLALRLSRSGPVAFQSTDETAFGITDCCHGLGLVTDWQGNGMYIEEDVGRADECSGIDEEPLVWC
jgi:hypothetical protein